MSNDLNGRRRLWYAALLGVGLWLARVALVPAPPQGVRVTGVSGAGPYYVTLSWGYGAGARPASVIFDLDAGGATGSITTDGEALEAEVPLGRQPTPPYSLVVSATFRILGFPRTVTSRNDDLLGGAGA